MSDFFYFFNTSKIEYVLNKKLLQSKSLTFDFGLIQSTKFWLVKVSQKVKSPVPIAEGHGALLQILWSKRDKDFASMIELEQRKGYNWMFLVLIVGLSTPVFNWKTNEKLGYSK